MRLKKYTDSVLEQFYLLTSIPIQAFNYKGDKITDYGLDEEYRQDFLIKETYKKLKNKYDNLKENTISTKSDIHYTILPVCPKNEFRGYFVLGPYTSNEKIKSVPYKPLSLRPFMASTLRSIWRSSPYIGQIEANENPYSFHVKKAIDYIEAKYMEDIKLDDISSYLDINKSYFCSIFKEETGSTFTQYLNKVRIDKSKELLLNENTSVLDIALAVGFNNQNYYNIVFKRLTDITPLEYRNRNIA